MKWNCDAPPISRIQTTRFRFNSIQQVGPITIIHPFDSCAVRVSSCNIKWKQQYFCGVKKRWINKEKIRKISEISIKYLGINFKDFPSSFINKIILMSFLCGSSMTRRPPLLILLFNFFSFIFYIKKSSVVEWVSLSFFYTGGLLPSFLPSTIPLPALHGYANQSCVVAGCYIAIYPKDLTKINEFWISGSGFWVRCGGWFAGWEHFKEQM